MNVAIVGSRPPSKSPDDALRPDATFTLRLAWERHHALIARVRAYVASLESGTIVVSGGARGVDKEAERAAKRHGLNVRIFYPNWERGMGAGFRPQPRYRACLGCGHGFLGWGV